MAASADSSASSKVLAINHSFFDISFFFPFYYYWNYGSYFQKEYNNEDVFTFCNNLSKN